MKAALLPLYLVGNRGAILEIAADRRALTISGLFVLSAGFAREYDGEDLFHEPWHVLRPLAGSVVSAIVVFALVYGAARLKSQPLPGFWRGFRSFLALFWMTAPLAWLYATPYERFMTPVEAVHANMNTLAVVAAWRVLLITRAASVLFGTGFVPMFFLVMLYADLVVFGVARLVPAPVFNIMAGTRPDDPDSVLAGAVFSMTILSVLSAPVWLIGAIVSVVMMKPSWATAPAPDAPRRHGLTALAVASVIGWAAVLPFTQAEQWRRHHVEALLRSGHVAEGLAEMSSRPEGDFPPHWDPPPRASYRETTPDLEAVRAEIDRRPPAPWVTERFVSKISRETRDSLTRGLSGRWEWLAEQAQYFESEDLARLEEHRPALEFLRRHGECLPEQDRGALESILRAADGAAGPRPPE